MGGFVKNTYAKYQPTVQTPIASGIGGQVARVGGQVAPVVSKGYASPSTVWQTSVKPVVATASPTSGVWQTSGTYKPNISGNSAASIGTVAQTYAPTYAEAGGGETGGYTAALPDYGYSVNIAVPSLKWQPTAEQLAQYMQQGQTRAATVVDPQIQAVLQALARFKTEATNQQNEINPRYTNMSLALANVIKNQMYQPGVNELIRRGAADSGALRQLQDKVGRYETEQRTGVEQERNSILNALANQVLGKEQETSDAQTALEKLRGQYTDVYSQEAEQTAWDRFLNETQGTFENQLAVEQLKNNVAAAIAEQQYRNAALQAQQEQAAFENSLSEKEFALQQALQNYQISRANSSSSPTKDTTVWVDTPYGKMTYAQAYQYGFAPGGQYNQQQNTTQAFLDWLNK